MLKIYCHFDVDLYWKYLKASSVLMYENGSQFKNWDTKISLFNGHWPIYTHTVITFFFVEKQSSCKINGY